MLELRDNGQSHLWAYQGAKAMSYDFNKPFWDNMRDAVRAEKAEKDEYERMKQGTVGDALAVENDWKVICCDCYQPYNLRLSYERVYEYTHGLIECVLCGGSEWNVVKANVVRYTDEAIEREVRTFFEKWSWWLHSDEGKLAQEKARYGL